MDDEWDKVQINCIAFEPIGPLGLATIVSVDETKAIILNVLKDRFPSARAAYECHLDDQLRFDHPRSPARGYRDKWMSFEWEIRRLKTEYENRGILLANFDNYDIVQFPGFQAQQEPEEIKDLEKETVGWSKRLASWFDRRALKATEKMKTPPTTLVKLPVQKPLECKDYHRGSELTWH